MMIARILKVVQKIDWYKLASLPGWRKNKNKQGTAQEETLKANMFYMVAPFLGPLKRWVGEQKKRMSQLAPETTHEQYITDDGLTQAEALRQPEATAEMPRASTANLMALLEKSSQATVAHAPTQQPHVRSSGVPELPVVHSDAADRLKQLLSVPSTHHQSGHSGSPAPTSQESKATDLLAMLRQGSTALLEPSFQPLPPRTPIEQVANIAYEPRRPSHQHTRLAEDAPARPPPEFAYTPARMAQDRQELFQSPSNHWSAPPQPAFAQAQPHQSAWYSQQNQRAPNPYEQHGARPVMMESTPMSQGPAPPSADQLPRPNLNSHAMSLLNMFKSNSKPNAAKESATAPLTPTPTNEQQISGNPALLELFRSKGPSATSKSPRPETRVLPAQAPGSSQSDPQQNALLRLLRTPSAMAPQVVEPPRTPLEQVPSVAKAPQSSEPQGPLSYAQVMTGQRGATSERRSLVNTIPSKPSQAEPLSDIIEAEAQTRHLDLPDSGTVRRHPRNKSPIMSSPGRSEVSSAGPGGTMPKTRRRAEKPPHNNASSTVEQRPIPIQILKRPTPIEDQAPAESPEKATITPAIGPSERTSTPKPQVTAAKAPTVAPASNKVSTPKPFQPQILRRPQQALPAEPLELPATNASPRSAGVPRNEAQEREENVTDKTKALMSLFRKAEPPALPAQPDQISKNVPPEMSPVMKSPALTLPVPAQQIVSPVDNRSALLSLFSRQNTSASSMQRPGFAKTPEVTRPAVADRQPSLQNSHQSSLLSLFGQPRAPPGIDTAAEPAQSALMSPVSVVSNGSSERRPTSGGTIAELKRGSIQSFGNGIGEGIRPRVDSTTSKDGIGSGRQTPISSTDRGFLLNYLQGLQARR